MRVWSFFRLSGPSGLGNFPRSPASRLAGPYGLGKSTSAYPVSPASAVPREALLPPSRSVRPQQCFPPIQTVQLSFGDLSFVFLRFPSFSFIFLLYSLFSFVFLRIPSSILLFTKDVFSFGCRCVFLLYYCRTVIVRPRTPSLNLVLHQQSQRKVYPLNL